VFGSVDQLEEIGPTHLPSTTCTGYPAERAPAVAGDRAAGPTTDDRRPTTANAAVIDFGEALAARSGRRPAKKVLSGGAV
jgi:hypothetical protein